MNIPSNSAVNVNLNIGAPVDPTLVEAKIVFTTYDGGDDKDANSYLKITLYTDYWNGFIVKIAYRDRETYGRFNDDNGGSINTIPLNLSGSLPLSSISNAKTKLEFDPNGDDTWKFHYSLDLKFSNGLVLSREKRNEYLSDGRRWLMNNIIYFLTMPESYL